MDIEIDIVREDVFAEVGMRTAYTGSKAEDVKLYDRVTTTSDDEAFLSRHWDEAKSFVCSAFRDMLESEHEDGGVWRLVLNVSSFYDDSQTDGLARSLKSFLSSFIACKWFALIDANVSASLGEESAQHLNDAKGKVLHKKKPTRPRY